MLDIAPLIIRRKNSLYHAILVVDKGSSFALYNWSYWFMSFRSDVRGGEDTARWPILCKNGNHLLGGLLGDTSEFVFLRGGTRWAVGNEYEPSAAYGNNLLSFRAVELKFDPLSAKDSSLYGRTYWSILIPE